MSLLVRMMDLYLFNTKPLSHPVMIYHQSRTISSNAKSVCQTKIIPFRKMESRTSPMAYLISRCRDWWVNTLKPGQNDRHFADGICISISLEISLIARFIGAHLGPTEPRWAPCWPHEPCYLGSYGTFVHSSVVFVPWGPILSPHSFGQFHGA